MDLGRPYRIIATRLNQLVLYPTQAFTARNCSLLVVLEVQYYSVSYTCVTARRSHIGGKTQVVPDHSVFSPVHPPFHFITDFPITQPSSLEVSITTPLRRCRCWPRRSGSTNQCVALLLPAANGAGSAAAGRLYDRVMDYPYVTSDVGLSMVGAKFGWSAVAPIATPQSVLDRPCGLLVLSSTWMVGSPWATR